MAKTTFTNLQIIPNPDNPNDPNGGFYPPRLTQAQINIIPPTTANVGCIVYNTTTNVLQTLNSALTWVNIIENNASITSIITTGTPPTFVLGPGAGGTPTNVAIFGSAVSGYISFTTGGATPTASGIVVTFTIPQLGTSYVPYITPYSRDASIPPGNSVHAAVQTPTSFNITSGLTALTNNTIYFYSYLIVYTQ